MKLFTTPSKMFQHISGTDHHLPEMRSETTKAGRRYITPDGNYYPSITTLLSYVSEEAINKWKKRVGVKEANKISKKATSRGTNMHELVEDYMYGRLKEDKIPAGRKIMFNAIKKHLNDIDNIHHLEAPLYSDILGVAGRCDCIAEFRGHLAVIDFKTSKKPKKRAWIENYFLQACFYSLSYQELTGFKAKYLVVIIANENATSDVFVAKRIDYVKKLMEVLTWTKEKHNAKSAS